MSAVCTKQMLLFFCSLDFDTETVSASLTITDCCIVITLWKKTLLSSVFYFMICVVSRPQCYDLRVSVVQQGSAVFAL